MGLPWGYLPRKGDVLVLHVEVKYDVEEGETNVHAEIPGQEWNTAIVPLDKVNGIERRLWKEGDRVRCLTDRLIAGKVIVQQGNYVWVAIDDGMAPGTYHSNDLELVPTPVAKPPEATDLGEDDDGPNSRRGHDVREGPGREYDI